MTIPEGHRPYGPKKSDETLVGTVTKPAPTCTRCGVPRSEYWRERGVYFAYCLNCGLPATKKKRS